MMPEATPDMMPEAQPDAEPEAQPDAEPESTLPQGEFLVGLQLAPVGGLVRPFHLTIESTANEDGSGVFNTIVLRAANDDFELSEPMGEASDVQVAADGSFVLDFDGEDLVLPGDFSPSSSDVVFNLAMEGKVEGAEFFCGDVTGELITFEFDLVGSTFAGIPFDQARPDFPSGCSGDGTMDLPRVSAEDCPTLSAGRNLEFQSADRGRQFEVVLPTQYDEGEQWPIVFLFHGQGGSADDFLGVADFQQLSDEFGFIVVVPDGLGEGGFSWEITTPENKDVAFFDDMLTCMGESFNLDSERIHVSGMSNGGLMTGLLTAVRAELLASTAPMSGGVLVSVPEIENILPLLIIWGGEEDEAFDQDFDTLAQGLREKFDDHFQVNCNHGLGHEVNASFFPYVFTFFEDHPLGVNPEPYSEGLPDVFPEFCE